MSGKFYMLVNPYIEGTISKVFRADNSFKAANMAYESISKYFNNSIHNFKFTLLKLKSNSVKINDEKNELNKFNLSQYGGSSKNKKFSSNNFSHFIVNERLDKDNEVEFKINKYTGKIENLPSFVDKVINVQKQLKSKKNINDSDSAKSESDSESIKVQDGGKKVIFDDEDDDSPDYYVEKTYYPISYWYYYPSLYTLDRLYLPIFTSPLSFPYVIDYPSISYNTYPITTPTVNVTY
jgi:hypothetical protein